MVREALAAWGSTSKFDLPNQPSRTAPKLSRAVTQLDPYFEVVYGGGFNRGASSCLTVSNNFGNRVTIDQICLLFLK